MKKNEKSKVGGFTVNSLVIPLSLILAVLIVVIALLTVTVNLTTRDLADMMQASSDYQQSATQLQAGTSVLSETASGFIQNPVIQSGPEAGTLNEGPLLAYAQELTVDRRASSIVAYFKERSASEEIQGYIDAAAVYSNQMSEMQIHAIGLITSVYPLSENPLLKLIPTVELTEEEAAMSGEARIGKAKSLLLGKDYLLLKSYVSGNIDSCHKAVEEQISAATVECKREIRVLRILLWTMIALVIVVMGATFLLFYRWLVTPIRQYSQDIASDHMLQRRGRVRELRAMVDAYNELWIQHNRLESMLRSAAETDALTNLPNRYRLERDIVNIDKKEGSLGVLLFDVNYLKVVNDTKGHQEGDRLLRRAANIIGQCFGVEDSVNCYRIGGDEFAAVLYDCTEEDLKNRIEKFKNRSDREGISIAVGYAMNTEMAHDFHRLMVLADERMYEQKKELHARMSGKMAG